MLNLNGLVMNEHRNEPSTGLILGSISGLQVIEFSESQLV